MLVSNRKKRRPERRAEDLSAERIANLAQEAVETEDNDEHDAELQGLYFAQLEEELQARERELTRLRELERNASPESADAIRRLVAKAESAVELQEQKVNAYLDKRPWLQTRAEEDDPWANEDEEETTVPHPTDADWRQQLVEMMHNRQSSWQGQLSAEQEKKLAEWQQAELSSLEDKYRHLEESLISRQKQLETAWSSQLQTIEVQKLREWMNQERERTLNALREDLATERRQVAERAQASRQQLTTEMERLAQQMLEQQTNELRLLEIEWREQEVIQRERPKLRKVWAELAAEQTQAMAQAVAETRRQLLENQQADSQAWLREQAVQWAKQQDEWLRQIRDEQQQSDLIRWNEQQEKLIKRAEQLLGEFQHQLAREQTKTEQRMLQLTGDWGMRSEEVLQQARASWQRGQEEQIALLQREWTRQLATEVRQTQNDWLQAKQNWAKRVSDDWAKMQQQAMPELRQLMNNWIKEQAQVFGTSKQQLEQQTSELIRQSKQLLDKTLEQGSRQSGEIKESFDRWLQQQASNLTAIQEQQHQFLAEQQKRGELTIQTMQHESELQLARDKAAATDWLRQKNDLLARLSSEVEHQATLQLQAVQHEVQQLALQQAERLNAAQVSVADWLKSGSADLQRITQGALAEQTEAVAWTKRTVAGLQTEHEVQLAESRASLDAWLKSQTEMMTALEQGLRRQQELQSAAMEQALSKRLEELNSRQTSFSADLINRFGSELAKGHTDLLKKTSEQTEALRAKADFLITERLSQLMEERGSEQQRALNAQVEAARLTLRSRTEDTCLGIQERYAEQLASLTAAVQQQLAEYSEQARLAAEQMQRERWMAAYEEMLEHQREELQRTVTETDQRLLEQLRLQIRAEVKAELDQERQEREQLAQQQAEQQRVQRAARRQR